MGLPIRLNSIFLGALLTLPLLLPMLSAVVLLYACQVSQGSRGIVMHTTLLRAHIHLLPHLIFVCSLLQLPRKVVPASMQLQILVSLKTLAANFTYETVGGHQGLG